MSENTIPYSPGLYLKFMLLPEIQTKTIHCMFCLNPIGTFQAHSLIPKGVILNSTNFDELEKAIHMDCAEELLEYWETNK